MTFGCSRDDTLRLLASPSSVDEVKSVISKKNVPCHLRQLQAPSRLPALKRVKNMAGGQRGTVIVIKNDERCPSIAKSKMVEKVTRKCASKYKAG